MYVTYIPIPVLAPVTMASLPLKSRPCKTDNAVLLLSKRCLIGCDDSLYSVANASRGSVYVVVRFI